nr:ABC transporter substrate-binding protein [Haloterrigena salifodinae]
MRSSETTRRKFIGAGAATGGALLAGCISGDAMDGSSGEAYTVSMEPMGEVEFEGVPERWTALLPSYADMAFALGGGQTLGIQNHARFGTEVYDELPGIEFDEDEVTELTEGGVDTELFYEMDADAHFIDPHILTHWYDWDRDDVDQVRTDVGPFFGNFIRRHSDEWHDYRYYDLYEALELMAEVFQARDRYDALVDLHETMLGTIDERLPPDDQRPTAMLVYPAESGNEFYPFRFDDGGISTKQWRDLGLTDALATTDVGHYRYGDRSTVDLETLLEIDPEVLLVRNHGGDSESEFREAVVEPLRDDPAASKVQAVKDDAVYSAGYLDQGPIINFYHTERAATDIYPDAFDDATLFDRERVAEIVTGEF